MKLSKFIFWVVVFIVVGSFLSNGTTEETEEILARITVPIIFILLGIWTAKSKFWDKMKCKSGITISMKEKKKK